MPVEPVELEACGQEGGVTFPSFYYFTLLFFYIGACNSPDKLLTIYIQQSQEFVQEFYFLYPKSETIKVQTKKVKLYIYFDFLLGAGGGRRGGGSRVVKGVGMEESAFPGPQMFNEDRYVVSLSRSILIEYAIQP